MTVVSLPDSSTELLQHGPRIRISISAPQMEIEEGRAVGLDYPPPLLLTALIDTGSSLTVLNPEVAVSCKLRPTGIAKVSAAGAVGRWVEYAATISFPDHGLKRFELIRVVGCPLPLQERSSCLIGRDLLRRWFFSYDGKTGNCTIEE
jgi:predicted aspartyl protease